MINKLRLRNGLTQAALAELLGVPESTLQGWEVGRRRPPGPKLAHIFEITGFAPPAPSAAVSREFGGQTIRTGLYRGYHLAWTDAIWSMGDTEAEAVGLLVLRPINGELLPSTAIDAVAKRLRRL